MSVPNIVIDTNVLVSALRSRRGASYKLMSLVGTGKFEIHISVALVIEYEDVIQRNRAEVGLSQDEVSLLIDSFCAIAKHQKIYFVWRPSLPDINDELILELAVSAQCKYIVTYNVKDFKGSELFGIEAVTPKEFLQVIGEVKE